MVGIIRPQSAGARTHILTEAVMKLRVPFILAISLSLLFLASVIANGQTSRGTLTGTVTDSSGGVIAKATITITQAGTNVTRQSTSNEAGIYRFDAVDLGTYTLSVQASGFTRGEVTSVEIQAALSSNVTATPKIYTLSQLD